jgi:nucleotide-binding universal stress UspA family protein
VWQRILVPHDFSPSANHAAALARDEAKAHGGEILLLHVVDLPLGYNPNTMVVTGDDGPIGMREYALRSATDHVEDLAQRLEAEGVEVARFVRVGRPVDEILAFAREHEVDAIVMGTHGRSGLSQLFAGSVTERVVRGSHVPVLTTRHP